MCAAIPGRRGTEKSSGLREWQSSRFPLFHLYKRGYRRLNPHMPVSNLPVSPSASTSTKSTAGAGTDEITLSTGFKLMLPFARTGWKAFATAAVLSTISSLAMLGPFWAIYRAVDDVVNGEATREGLFFYAALTAVFLILQYAFAAASEWTSHRGAYATLEQLRLRTGQRLTRGDRSPLRICRASNRPCSVGLSHQQALRPDSAGTQRRYREA